MCRNLGCAERRLLREARHDTADPGWAPPDPVERRQLGATRKLHRRGQRTEAPRPLVAPDAQIHVHDVVVRDRQPSEPVRDRERPPLVRGPVVPDDPHALRARLDAVRAGHAEAPELGARPGDVVIASFGDADVVDRLSRAERDVAVRAAEVAREVERDLLAHEERPVRLDLHGDVGVGERVRLRAAGGGPEQRGREEKEECGAEPAQLENCTAGASRAAPSVSKYACGLKLKSPATMFVGTVSRALSYVSTASL